MYVEQNGTDTTSRHGDAHAQQKSGSDSSTYWKDKKKSTQITEKHSHMRFKENYYWQDEGGNYFFPPPLVKKDDQCKE